MRALRAVESDGVEVLVDGVTRGVTPAKLALTPGSHILELRGRGVFRHPEFGEKKHAVSVTTAASCGRTSRPCRRA